MTRIPLLAALILAALPAAAQTQGYGTTAPQPTWQQGGAGTWQPVPGSPRPVQGGAPSANNLAPDLSDNYQRLRRQRQLNDRVESGSSLIMQGVIPRGSR